MKKFLNITLLFCFMAVSVFAQVNPQAPLELDKSVKVGKLDNGLTYYIKKNSKPANRADFYLITDVGAIQETPAQDGLAHFLEHMCLNGTKNFPGKGIISYMESVGAKFGANINAGTGVEQTSYQLVNIPITRKGVIDSSILILHDYAAYVTNDPKEIDSERGVIIEEWRTRRDASQRMRESVMANLFKGSKYATCNIIGTKENLETFKPEELVSFYKTWYRPDLQAVVVVGDFDENYVEAKIKEIFSTIPKAINPKAKDVITIPENDEPIISIFTDKEVDGTNISFYIKSEAMPKEYRAMGVAVLNDIMEGMISTMLSERLSDISKKADAPFIQASAGFSNICKTTNVFYGDVSSKDGEGLNAFKALYVEIERAKKFGFTQEEYDRAKTNILRSLEVAKDNADSRTNDRFVRDYMSHFVSGDAYMTPEYTYNTYKAYLDMLPVAALNQAISQVIRDKNMVISFVAPQKDGLVTPTEKDLLAALEAARNTEIKALESVSVNVPLIENTTALKGSKVNKTEQGKFGTTIWTLSNGIKVIIKPTDYKKDEVLIKSIAKGGRSILPVELLPSLESNIYQVFMSNAGISKFPQSQLTKMLSGKYASASKYIGQLEQGVNAGGSPKDLETIMQLIYLNYTATRVEASELEVGLNQIKAVLPNMLNQPNYKFSMAIQRAMADSPRNPLLDEQMLAKVSAENIKKAFDMLFADAVGTTFYITGNVNLETLKPLVEKYIGSLTVKAKKARSYVDHNLNPKKGILDKSFNVKMETPKTSVAMIYSTDAVKANLENDIVLDALQAVMDMTYTKTIREDEGGTYGVGVESAVSGEPKDFLFLAVIFDTDFAKSKKLIDLAKKGFQDIASNGPNEEYLTKAKENLLKVFPEQQIKNSYWHNIIQKYYNNGKDNNSTYLETVNKVVTSENVKNMAKQILDANNRIDIIMNPEQ